MRENRCVGCDELAQLAEENARLRETLKTPHVLLLKKVEGLIRALDDIAHPPYGHSAENRWIKSMAEAAICEALEGKE